MKTTTIVFLTLIILSGITGCSKKKPLDGIKIQVSIPPDFADPNRRSKVILITYDVTKGRVVFEELYNTTKRRGMCNPMDIIKRYNARMVLTVCFWGENMSPRETFYILENEDGQWIQTSFGGAEIIDDPEGFPVLEYSPQALARLKDWYEKYIPQKYKDM